MVKVVKMVKKNSMPDSYVTLKFSADACPGINAGATKMRAMNGTFVGRGLKYWPIEAAWSKIPPYQDE